MVLDEQVKENDAWPGERNERMLIQADNIGYEQRYHFLSTVECEE